MCLRGFDIERAEVDKSRWVPHEWQDARIEVLAALDRKAEAQAFRWACFERDLSPDYLRTFLKRLADFADIDAEERAMAFAASSRPHRSQAARASGTSSSTGELRRALRAIIFAMAAKKSHGEPAYALQSCKPEIRLFCLAAIATVQKRPLLKAALLSANMGGFARVALLRAYQKQPRLLAAVDRIALRRAKRSNPEGSKGTVPAGSKSHN